MFRNFILRGWITGLIIAGILGFTAYGSADEGNLVKDKDGFILGWLVCGPFPNYLPDDKTDYGHHTKLCWGYAHDFFAKCGGEAGITPSEGMECTYEGRKVVWEKCTSENRIIDFNTIFPPGTNSVAYAHCEIDVPEAIEGIISAGSDDGIKIWLNHKLVLDHHVARGVAENDDTLLVNFKKGKNQLLVKVDNDWGGFGFCLQTATTEKEKLGFVFGLPAAQADSVDIQLPHVFGNRDIRLPHVFGSHMVLQREKPVVIWGWAEPSEKITVRIQSEQKKTSANKRGEWKAILPAMKAGGPYTLTVSGTNTITLTDVMVGEVWLCSGQSNMAIGVAECLNAEQEISAADYPGIRLLAIPCKLAFLPQPDVDATWNVCTPATIGGFSAVAYYFGREIHRTLGVPVGLIQSAWGATKIEPWTSPEGFAAVPALKAIYDQIRLANTHSEGLFLKARENWLAAARNALNGGATVPVMPPFPVPLQGNQSPTVLYNSMIYPLIPFPIRGAIWYQGEGNCGDGMQYVEKTKALVNGWRRLWNQGDFPFYYVQIAPWNFYGGEALPEFWEAQAAIQNAVPNTAMALTIDIGDPNDIHPKNKQDVGKRLALLALAKTYGQNNLVCTGPTYKSMSVESDKIRVSFDNVGSGLVSRDGKPLNWFEIIDAGTGRFVTAKAEINGITVVLSAAGVKHPTAVRFGWNKIAQPNLMNREGLPAAPFRAGTVTVRNLLAMNVSEAKDYQLVYDLNLGKIGVNTPISVFVGTSQSASGNPASDAYVVKPLSH